MKTNNEEKLSGLVPLVFKEETKIDSSKYEKMKKLMEYKCTDYPYSLRRVPFGLRVGLGSFSLTLGMLAMKVYSGYESSDWWLEQIADLGSTGFFSSLALMGVACALYPDIVKIPKKMQIRKFRKENPKVYEKIETELAQNGKNYWQDLNPRNEINDFISHNENIGLKEEGKLALKRPYNVRNTVLRYNSLKQERNQLELQFTQLEDDILTKQTSGILTVDEVNQYTQKRDKNRDQFYSTNNEYLCLEKIMAFENMDSGVSADNMKNIITKELENH